MWFESLKLTNYRNVGNPGVELLAVGGLNTIVGGNNVGKSSLFAALKTLWDGEGYTARDQHWGSGDAQLGDPIRGAEVGPFGQARIRHGAP